MKFYKRDYEYILEYALSQNYVFVDFLTVNLNGDRQIILRHDVDYSLPLAFEMAKIDAKYHIKSTFAILLNYPLYNPFTPANELAIQLIHELGHHIVLHQPMSPKRDVIRNFNSLRTFFPYAQPVFVWHQPTDNLSMDVEGLINAYDFTKEMHYISDSLLRNRPGDFLSALDNHRLIHMLTHPIVWLGGQENMEGIISYAINDAIKACERECGR